jgi:proline iminopeptidase
MKQIVSDAEMHPVLEPLQADHLSVGGCHRIYYEERGNKTGVPVILLHGGPGSFSKAKNCGLFNPEKYRIITFDQRGCGKSESEHPLDNNTTKDLVDDIEKIRKHLGIGKLLVAGGSWGSTLALLYAQRYPQNVLGVAVWAVFLADDFNLKWLLNPEGAARFFPQEYADFMAAIDETNARYILPTCERLLKDEDEQVRFDAAKALLRWESRGMGLAYHDPDPELEETEELRKELVCAAQIWVAYACREFDLQHDQILTDVFQLSGLPGLIVHGRYDLCCPPRNAWQLHRRWADSKLVMLDEAAHSKDEMLPALIKALDTFAEKQHF